jgi:hypothetical protein
MKRALTVALMTVAMMIPTAAAFADPIEIGACGYPDAIVVRVGQTAKVCVNP